MVIQRRTFIRNAAVASAGFSILPSFAFSRTRLTAGLAGCSERGLNNLFHFLEVPGVKCSAIYDADPAVLKEASQKIEAFQGSKVMAFTNCQRMIETGGLDILLDDPLSELRGEPSVLACKSGIIVYPIRPLQYHTVKLLMEFGRTCPVKMQSGIWQRSDCERQALLQHIKGRAGGNIKSARIWFYRLPSTDNDYHESFAGFADFILSAFGESYPESVLTCGGNYFSHGIAGFLPDTYVSLVKTSAKSILIDHSSGYAGSNYGLPAGVEIKCEKEIVVLGQHKWQIINNKTGLVTSSGILKAAEDPGSLSRKRILDFVNTIRSGTEITDGPDADYGVALITQMEYNSFKLHRRFLISEISA